MALPVLLNENITRLLRGVESSSRPTLLRVLRHNVVIRREVTLATLGAAIKARFPASSPTRDVLMSFVGSSDVRAACFCVRPRAPCARTARSLRSVPPRPLAPSSPPTSYVQGGDMDVEGSAAAVDPAAELVPELEIYLGTLVLSTLLRLGASRLDDAIACADALRTRCAAFNRRTMDLFASKTYYYYARAYDTAGRLSTVRPQLLALHRTACLRHDDMGQAMLLNILVGDYVAHKQFGAASNLVKNVVFPHAVSNAQLVRHHYYVGFVRAMELEYSEAKMHLTEALRKAPQAVKRLSAEAQADAKAKAEAKADEEAQTRKKAAREAAKAEKEAARAVALGVAPDDAKKAAGALTAAKKKKAAAAKKAAETVQNEVVAVQVGRGFRVAATKLVVLVRLLMSETPERHIFNQPEMREPLQPYFLLTRAVRAGDLRNFQQVATEYSDAFTSDGLASLVDRLRHNVLKAGLCSIARAYSRISIDDIRVRLGLETNDETECVSSFLFFGAAPLSRPRTHTQPPRPQNLLAQVCLRQGNPRRRD